MTTGSKRHDAPADGGYPEKRVIVRFHAGEMRDVVAAFEAAGFAVMEANEAQRPALAA